MIPPEMVHMNFDWDDERLIRDHDLSDPARPVDNVSLVVGGDAASGRVDFITRWKPGHYCTYHRHLGDTVSIVLAGEHWVEREDGTRKRRLPGHYSFAPAGESHRELAGPEGSTVFFSIHSADGRAFQSLDAAGEAVSEGSTIAQMLSRLTD
jgi:quercetin dioxygenase-like cupin family protein